MSLTLHPVMAQDRALPPEALRRVVQVYGGHYVGDFPGKLAGGGWTPNMSIAVFYRDEPDERYPNRYYGMFIHPVTARLNICNADYVDGHVFNAISSPDGIAYSTFCHDFRRIGDATIDGGWDYAHASGETILVQVRDGRFEEVVNESAGN